MNMSSFLDWLTSNNTQIIQIVFTILLVLLSIYVYRIFTSSPQPTNFSGSSSGDIGQVEQKLNQILEHQKISGQVSTIGSGQSAAVATDEELDRLKSEIYNLRQQLNESEKKVFELTPGDNASSAVDGESSAEVAATVSLPEDLVKIKEMNKEIDVLKAKLSDYEIIAEDISDLSDLREENKSLKEKLESLQGSEAVTTDAASEASELTEVVEVAETSATEQAPATDPAFDIDLDSLLDDKKKDSSS